MSTQDDIKKECDALKELLLEKNRKYGDSALSPERVFSKANAVEQIKVRIDDKISRLKSAQKDEDEDVVLDLLGYLVLLRIAQKRQKKAQASATCSIAADGPGLTLQSGSYFVDREEKGIHLEPSMLLFESIATGKVMFTDKGAHFGASIALDTRDPYESDSTEREKATSEKSPEKISVKHEHLTVTCVDCKKGLHPSDLYASKHGGICATCFDKRYNAKAAR